MDELKALRVAETQLKNKASKLPFDYGAILTYRKHDPSLFVDLPSDDECKAELVKLGHTEWDGETLVTRKGRSVSSDD